MGKLSLGAEAELTFVPDGLWPGSCINRNTKKSREPRGERRDGGSHLSKRRKSLKVRLVAGQSREGPELASPDSTLVPVRSP